MDDAFESAADTPGETENGRWDAVFPPAGMIERAEASRRCGVSLGSLRHLVARGRLRNGRLVKQPGTRARVTVFPLEDVEQLAAELRVARAEGSRPAFVGRGEACRILGITPRAFKHWITDGKLSCGVIVPDKVGGRRSLYPVEALRALRAEMLGRDQLFKGAAGTFTVPPGWVRRREACVMLGVGRSVWERWSLEGLLPRSERFDGGPTVYRVEDLKRMLERAGLLARPRPIADGSDTYRVPLCGGNAGGREAIIDGASLVLLEGAVLSWRAVKGGDACFVGLCRPETPRGVPLRRVIMGVTDAAMNVRHLNGDRLDCRRANLVVRTVQERTQNTSKMKGVRGQPCSSRFKGVCFEKRTGRWRARIVIDGTTRRLGRFHDEIAAAQAYDEAARELFGEHAWLNFPGELQSGGLDARLEREAMEAERAAVVVEDRPRAAA